MGGQREEPAARPGPRPRRNEEVGEVAAPPSKMKLFDHQDDTDGALVRLARTKRRRGYREV